MNPEYSIGYRPSIEGIRALSILCVMLVHTDMPGHEGGFLSVDASFVVSGFLITSSILSESNRTGQISLKKFYMRRALRILPALAAMIAAWIVVSLSFGWYDLRGTLKMSLFAGTYLSNWAIGLHWIKTLDAVSQTWSLAIEEQFYLLWPPLLALLTRAGTKSRTLIMAVAGGVLLSAVLRAVMWNAGGDFMRIIYGTDTRGAGALLLGCLLGILSVHGRLEFVRPFARLLRVGAWFGVFILLGSIGFLAGRSQQFVGDFTFYGGLTATTISVFVVMIYLLTQPGTMLERALSNRVLVWIGNMSYSLFVWHLLVYNVVKEILNPAQFTVGFAAAQLLAGLAVGAASFYLIEKPCLNIRRRFRVLQGQHTV